MTRPPPLYRLAPALGARLMGRCLVMLAVLVLLATVVGLLAGGGWTWRRVVAAVGLVLVAGWAWSAAARVAVGACA